MRERDIEHYLVKRVGQMGGHAYKFTSPGRRSVPDRLVLLPLGISFFVECKAPGEALTDLQRLEHVRMRHLAARVHVVTSFAEIEAVLANEWFAVEKLKAQLGQEYIDIPKELRRGTD